MKRSLATVFALCIATSAWASGPVVVNDAPPVAAPLPTAYNWTGGYAGLRIGLPTGQNHWAERGFNASTTPGNWDGSPWGATFGYDRQTGVWVYGVALDYTAGAINARSTTSGTFGCPADCDTRVEQGVALRGRVGRAMDRSLVYATLGVASAQATASLIGFGVRGQGRLTGWTAGVGVEHAVTDHVSINLEYLLTDLGRLEIPTSCGVNCYSDVHFGTIRLGANYRW